MDLQLNHKTVVITGGASGIGLATARGFAREGAKIVLWDLNPAVTEAAAAITEEFSVSAMGMKVDITSEDEVLEATRETVSKVERIDCLVHAAAIGSGKFGFPFTNLQPADWHKILQVNVMGMVHVAHAVAPVMREQQAGSMVFLASVAGQIGSQTDPPYSAAKAANINFAQVIAKDLAPHGIRVNTVCPGMVQTPLNRSVWQAWHDQTTPDQRLDYETWAGQKIKAIVPLGKWQTPEAIADMIVFLSSARAEHVTGQTINVDGGFVMHR
ncbi:MAG: SDR family oxidoreductase [Pirellulaceae bacterium]